MATYREIQERQMLKDQRRFLKKVLKKSKGKDVAMIRVAGTGMMSARMSDGWEFVTTEQNQTGWLPYHILKKKRSLVEAEYADITKELA